MEERGQIRDAVRIRVGISIFSLLPSHLVTLGQVDHVGRKRIVDFGHRHIDWMPFDWIERHVEILSQASPT